MIDLTKIRVGQTIEVKFGGDWTPAVISRELCGYTPNNLPRKLPDFMANTTKFDCLVSLWIEDYQNKWRFIED